MHTTRPVALIALVCAFACGAVAALALTRTNDVEQLIAVDKRQQGAYLTKDMAALECACIEGGGCQISAVNPIGRRLESGGLISARIAA